MLHTYNNGAVLRLMSAKELITIPIWKGNRILDQEHANTIKKGIHTKNINCLDSGYSIIKYNELTADNRQITVSYLIDGQHRASVIRDFYNDTVCEPDFQVTVTERTVESESDAIEQFNMINNVKRQYWKTDINLIINKYIQLLEKQFNVKGKTLLFRQGATNRPYLSSDKVRETLMKVRYSLKQSDDHIVEFVRKCVKKNIDLINQFQLELTGISTVKDRNLKERAVSVEFALAYDINIQWIRELI